MNFAWESSFPFFRLSGEGTIKFLQGQTTADLLSLKPGEVIKTCALFPNGKLKALLEIRVLEKGVDCIVLSGHPESYFKDIEAGIFPADKVDIKSIGNIKRVQEMSLEKSWKDSRLEWIYSEIDSVPDSFINSKYAGINEFEIWRLKQGFPIYKMEINGETNPFELGLLDLIDLKKGCFIGQESISRMYSRGETNNKLRYWVTNSNVKDVDVGQKLFSGNSDSADRKICGTITSAFKSENGFWNGLSIVNKKYSGFKNLFLAEPSGKVNIQVPISFVDFK